jgi:hypothetical protein
MRTDTTRPNAYDEAVLRKALRSPVTESNEVDALFEYVRGLALPPGDFAIFGSGPFIVRGWISGTNDLDVICRGTAWSQACQAGTVSYDERYDVSLASHCNGRVTFGTRWAIGHFDIDELIDSAETIDGLPFVQLKHVVAYKELRASAKDLLHLEQYRRAIRS